MAETSLSNEPIAMPEDKEGILALPLEQRDDIIFVRASGYGLTGEYADARTLGAHLEGVMGHQVLRGYEGAGPSTNSPIFSADYVSGTQIALSVPLALWHRNNTGKGQFIELAQAENAAAMFAQAYLDYALTGTVQSAIGNRSIYAADGVAPCGVYPCLPDGAGGPAAGGGRPLAPGGDRKRGPQHLRGCPRRHPRPLGALWVLGRRTSRWPAARGGPVARAVASARRSDLSIGNRVASGAARREWGRIGTGRARTKGLYLKGGSTGRLGERGTWSDPSRKRSSC